MTAIHFSRVAMFRISDFFLAFILALFCCLSSVQAEDWTTIDGKVYPEVKVLKVEPDAVTIIYRDGGALIPLPNLPADLQQRFHYDPAAAKAATEARARTDAESAKLLQDEMAAAAKIKAANNAKEKALQAQLAAEKLAEQRQESTTSVQEPSVLESNQKLYGDALAPTKDVVNHPIKDATSSSSGGSN